LLTRGGSKQEYLAVSLAAGALLVRQLYLVSRIPPFDTFYTPAHDLAVSLALSSSGSISGAEGLVPREAIYATYPALHIFVVMLGSITGMSISFLWNWIGFLLDLLLFLAIFLAGRRLAKSNYGGAIALSYLLLSDRLLDNGIHIMRETFAIPLSMLSLYVVLMMVDLPFQSLDIVLITFSMVASFSHPVTAIATASFMLLMIVAGKIAGRPGVRIPALAATITVVSWYLYQSPRYLGSYAVMLRGLIESMYGPHGEYIVPPYPTSSSVGQLLFYSLKWAGLFLGGLAIVFTFIHLRSRRKTDPQLGTWWYLTIGVTAFLAYAAVRAGGWRFGGLANVADLFNRLESYVFMTWAPVLAFAFTRTRLARCRSFAFLFLLVSGILIAFTSPGTSGMVNIEAQVSDHFPSLSTMWDFCGSKCDRAILTPDDGLPSAAYIEATYLRPTIGLHTNDVQPTLLGSSVIFVYVDFEVAAYPPNLSLNSPNWSTALLGPREQHLVLDSNSLE
jgi:hypothetical protein